MIKIKMNSEITNKGTIKYYNSNTSLKTRKLVNHAIRKFVNRELTSLIHYLHSNGVKNPIMELKKLNLPYAYIEKSVAGSSSMFYDGYFVGEKANGQLIILSAKSNIIECRQRSF